ERAPARRQDQTRPHQASSPGQDQVSPSLGSSRGSMRGVAPLIGIESAALPMKFDRQGRAPRGPYFFFFLVAFFLATVSPPSVGFPRLRIAYLLGMLERSRNSVKIKKQHLGA